MTFLIIEDSPSIASLLVRSMSTGGHRVVVTSMLSDAMETARALQPDVIMLDLGLPDSIHPDRTVEKIPEFKEASPKSAIVVFTGYLTEAIHNRAHELGAHVVQKKDETFTEGMDLVRRAIHKQNATMNDILAAGSMLVGENLVSPMAQPG